MMKRCMFTMVVTAFCASLAVITAMNAQTTDLAPDVALQGATAYSFNVGDVRVSSLSDGTVPQDLHSLLRGTDGKKIDQDLDDAFQINPVEASINAFFFKLGERFVLVDCGSGEMFGPGFGGKLLQSLSTIGIRPDEITDILLTHLHDDHMGGLVRGEKVVFPNATVHVSKADITFFLDRTNAERTHYDISYFDQAAKALRPYLGTNKIKTFEDGNEVFPGVHATVHPGHTPGSTFYTLVSHNQRVVFVGDLAHVSAVQFEAPSVTIVYDVDPAKAASVREHAFDDFAQDRTLIAFPHMPFPGVGHVRVFGSGFAWVPVTYGNRDLSLKSNFGTRHSASTSH